jgi:phthalate 4,5-cis-dihydrodiol dehydrogenase
MTEPTPTIRLGVVGLGVAAASVLPAADAMPEVELVAGADVNPKNLEVFKTKWGKRTYGSIDELLRDPDVNAVWVSTPNVFHAPHVIQAAQAGKHVIVEKPFAITLDQAREMIAAADKADVHLLSGGSRSACATVRKMREVLASGELGRLRAMSTWCATDWMLRPRRPDELDMASGGGIAYRQSPHQVDTMRLLAGGMAHSVRAMTGAWMAPRDTAPGFYSVYLEFEDGTPGNIIYEAYGYFMASELFEGGRPAGTDERVQTRKEIVTGRRDEAAAKEERALDAQRAGSMNAVTSSPRSRYLSDLGIFVVSCEHGDMRQSPNGIYVYGDDGTREITFDENRAGYSPELIELHEAITTGKPVLHGGRWGMATLEVSLAIMESARERKEVYLHHQVPVPAGA